MKLPTKILLLITPLVVLPIIFIGIAAIHLIEDSARTRADDATAALVQQLEHALRDAVSSAKANLELFAQSDLLHRYVLTEDEAVRYSLMQPPLLRQFASYRNAYPEYYDLRLVTMDGEEDTRSTLRPFSGTIERILADSFMKELAKVDAVSHHRIVHDAEFDRLVLLAGRKLLLRDPRLDPILGPLVERGYLIVSIDLQPLLQEISSSLPEPVELFLLDSEGRSLPVEGIPGRDTVFRMHENVEMLSSGPDGGAALVKDGERSAVVRTLHLYDSWFFLASYSMSNVQAATRLLGVQITLVTLLVGAFAVALLFSVLRFILVRPLKQLTLAARAIGNGILDHSINVSSKDEVGLLANTFREMSQKLQESSRQISFLAYHDSLTGLPNRVMFREFLVHSIAHAKRNDERLALLFLDIDNFKKVNDAVGHPAGDELLKRLALQIVQCLREEDFVSRANVARLGGDEFLILLSEIQKPYDAGKVAARISMPFLEPVRLEGQEFHITSSIGISTFPEDGEDADILLRNADAAMYHAKRLGKNGFQFFSQGLNDAIVERVNLEAKLRPALDRGEFMLYYQPQVSLETGEILGLEALLRWNQPELGMVSPDRFIPLAEENGLIVPIGLWVLNTVCAQIADWRERGIEPVPVAFNVSATQINGSGLPEALAAALEKYRLSPGLLELELTETTFMHAPDQAIAVLAKVKSLGVAIALDDFGTGYSSLSHLRRFAIDRLKIDRSFVADITTDPDDAAIVAGVVALAHSLGLEVIAEGVETVAQKEFLLQHGCVNAQGYLMFHPEPGAAVEQRLRSAASVPH
ncbi:MAG TPA: EAL domain-containing protein [Thioalkalivibrio sp.]|nr:EAL domain-containing protein [Thioalkalivibrio sp.]